MKEQKSMLGEIEVSDKGNVLERLNFGFISSKYYIGFLIITLIGIFTGAMPKGFLGGFLICTVLGLLMEKIGDNLPIVKDYFGGGPIVALFGTAALVYFNVFPESTSEQVIFFVKKIDYIGMVVGALICGSILTMDRKLLIRAGALYLVPITGGIVLAMGLVSVVATFMGFGWREGILFVALPILGGGSSAGAVPTSQIYGSMFSQGSDYYLSLIMPAVALGNAVAIVVAGLSKKLGKQFPALTGNGVLMKGFNSESENKQEGKLDLESLGVGLLITAAFFTMGILMNKIIPGIHYYAWTIIVVGVVKIFGLFPKGLDNPISQWSKLVSKIGIPAVLFGIGFVYTDLKVVIESVTPTYLILVLVTVIGAFVGAALLGKLIGFYSIESGITAGLCMANMGGSGDIATLGAADQMGLMPFAQISSRIGGAIIIVLTSVLASFLGTGL